jgi:hypothetical protein
MLSSLVLGFKQSDIVKYNNNFLSMNDTDE